MNPVYHESNRGGIAAIRLTGQVRSADSRWASAAATIWAIASFANALNNESAFY
jgi:hypothetical protein